MMDASLQVSARMPKTKNSLLSGIYPGCREVRNQLLWPSKHQNSIFSLSNSAQLTLQDWLRAVKRTSDSGGLETLVTLGDLLLFSTITLEKLSLRALILSMASNLLIEMRTKLLREYSLEANTEWCSRSTTKMKLWRPLIRPMIMRYSRSQ